MNTTSLQHKTIRPGSLSGYSYYSSGATRRQPVVKPARVRSSGLAAKLTLTLLAVAAIIVLPLLRSEPTGPVVSNRTDSRQSASINRPAPANSAPAALAGVPSGKNHCADNTDGKLIKVSIGQRRLWACEGSKTVHETPVITGLETLESNLTPRGTYHIYAKQHDTRLRGNDARGSWDRPVQYWMPFLDNQHGTYGFHDATWKPDSAFGNVDPNTSQDSSRGCVELPLSSQKWLYDWAPVHTTVRIEN